MLFKLLSIPSWAKGFLAATGIAGGAATIDIVSSAPVIAENIWRGENNESFLHLVDRQSGY